ncbi:MAG: DUF3048 domain-containing protein [Acidimicrobiales bacterium]
MRRHHRTLLGALCVGAIGALLASTPARAQIDPGQLGELERRRDELTVQISEIDAELEVLAVEIKALEDEQATQRVEVELLADDIEWTAFTREEPAATRVQIAIFGFTRGDPRQNELLNEILTLEGDDEPSRRRALYESVIDDTMDRLAVIDARLADLGDDLATTRDRLGATGAALADAIEARRTGGVRRSELADELTEIQRRIDELKALEARAVLTGMSTFDDPTRPALAVKIDNVSAARPQAGINQADIVFVEEVEGGLTRLAAVFHSQGADVVGPVRSMRTGDFDLLAQFNGPLFANSGGNRGARGALANSTLVDVGVNAQSGSYYRESSRQAPHNLFTNAFNLWVVGRDLEGAGTPSPIFQFRPAGQELPSEARPIAGATINYGNSSVDYSWNGTGWERSQDGQPTVDADGVRVAPTTVVVQFVDYVASSADAASPEAVTVGDGQAWVLTAGQLVPTTWTRQSLADQTDFTLSSGSEAAILPGKIWIELPRPGRANTR